MGVPFLSLPVSSSCNYTADCSTGNFNIPMCFFCPPHLIHGFLCFIFFLKKNFYFLFVGTLAYFIAFATESPSL